MGKVVKIQRFMAGKLELFLVVNDTFVNKGCYFHVTGVFQITYKQNN